MVTETPMHLKPISPLVSALGIPYWLVALRRTEGSERARGVSWVIYDSAGTNANGFKNFGIKGAFPYTMYTDKGNVIDAWAVDDWLSADRDNDSAPGDDIDVMHGLAGNEVLFGDAGDDKLWTRFIFRKRSTERACTSDSRRRD